MREDSSRSSFRESKRNFRAGCEWEDTLIRLQGIRSIGSTYASGFSRMRESLFPAIIVIHSEKFRRERTDSRRKSGYPPMRFLIFFSRFPLNASPLSPSKVSVHGN